MLELSALGLLQKKPLHGYRLKQQLELFMSSCISINYGAIYPLLKRLEERGYIFVVTEEPGEAGCSRKIYQITEKGRDRWREKMLENLKESWVKGRSRFLIKFFFFSDLEPIERVKLIEHRLIVCQLRQEYLDSQQSENIQRDPYQFSAWNRAKSMLNSEMQWLREELVKELELINFDSNQAKKHNFNSILTAEI
ncbi:MAG: PadR family transcriptional regulator [Okeania sp. SIO2G4]|uniref:PadR family transcriptional regulator n=1 Tax=unclassified Okeania TaxID=2634635 RepID=UPI0013B700F8|nr:MULTISPECIES: PadR family transcriptional regulator [unclassified Okeania]NEP03936.1 PadR family transcriptional regulator [Okeania sp. SIO4D6]NEP44639.1 PadR family transcriptional regulator [Okeania sp. SIO2H7]NEP71402.1 PadR family transcriptional regulator [Okeania sp. SIO2G5]NEP92706.1 PadR family transcriptional regulator [Okeania sp. SIO2F5]NEQ90091.1 PadR family transcriptional regulator [Okeania sp. SIO2G4]